MLGNAQSAQKWVEGKCHREYTATRKGGKGEKVG